MASSFESAPQGLVAILKMTYSNATGKAGWSKLYIQLYGILWVSSALMAGNLWIQSTSQSPFFFQYGGKIGTGHCEGNHPTYLFPVAIKEVTRVHFSTGTRCGFQAWYRRQRSTRDSDYYTGLVIHADVQIAIIRIIIRIYTMVIAQP